MLVLSGSNSTALCSKVCNILKMKVGRVRFKEFGDKEKFVEVLDDVSNQEVVLIQSISTPTNDNLMELVLLSDALRRASAKRITIVAPYIGYSRQDRCSVRGAPLSFKIIANFLSQTGADKLFTLDLHSEQTQGLFNLGICNLNSSSVFAEKLLAEAPTSSLIIVSPDCGSATRARRLAQKLGCDTAIAGKMRLKDNSSKLLGINGSIEGMVCVVLDDIIDTGSTISDVSKQLKLMGALRVCVYATHPILSNSTFCSKIPTSIDELVVTDSINFDPPKSTKIKIISIAGLLAEAIKRDASNPKINI
ncbi:phosphoribosylpyrophosphate synthetase [Candidatus Tremblaya phenacola PAVE]|nr:phosphoribosylpyrophosphate synthetase [Candidatus Tremblaya phenacola PAVE]